MERNYENAPNFIKKRVLQKTATYGLAIAFFFVGVFGPAGIAVTAPLTAYATTSADKETLTDAQIAEQKRQEEPVDTNSVRGWPQGPVISAQAAILMDADSGTILYAKNIHQHLYPASTTKMMTCLLAVENCSLDENVVISADAVSAVPSDGSSIGSNPGDEMPMSECLYAILVASANEIANAVGEHIAGDDRSFVFMMNQKARELGCEDTHFANANGLHDSDHYTSAYDLALIAREFFKNDTLYRIGNTASHHFVATDTRSQDFTQVNKHKLITGEVAYSGIIGGKTGYTSAAMQTLITGCERDGMRLICVVLKEDNPTQFTDTVALFDYGYSNFTSVKIAEADTTYAIGGNNFYETGRSIFAGLDSIFYLDESATAVIPKHVNFNDCESSLEFVTDEENPDHLANVIYRYNGQQVGSSALYASEGFLDQIREGKASLVSSESESETESGTETLEEELLTEGMPIGLGINRRGPRIILVNVKTVVIFTAAIGAGMMLLMFIYAALTSREDLYRERRRLKQMRRDQKIMRRNEKKERRHRMRHRY